VIIHKTHKRQTSMPPAGFEPVIPASEQPQTKAKDKAISIQAWTVPSGFQEVEAPRISKQSAHECDKLSAICKARLYSKEISLILISFRG
jgi:hypothetical protein